MSKRIESWKQRAGQIFHGDGEMKMRVLPLTLPKDELKLLCRQYHIRRLALFGSVLRDDFRPDSDIDMLVEFDPEHIPGFFQLAHIERGLSALLGGRKVDLRTAEDLSRYFRDDVLATTEVLYEEK